MVIKSNFRVFFSHPSDWRFDSGSQDDVSLAQHYHSMWSFRGIQGSGVAESSSTVDRATRSAIWLHVQKANQPKHEGGRANKAVH